MSVYSQDEQRAEGTQDTVGPMGAKAGAFGRSCRWNPKTRPQEDSSPSLSRTQSHSLFLSLSLSWPWPWPLAMLLVGAVAAAELRLTRWVSEVTLLKGTPRFMPASAARWPVGPTFHGARGEVASTDWTTAADRWDPRARGRLLQLQ